MFQFTQAKFCLFTAKDHHRALVSRIASFLSYAQGFVHGKAVFANGEWHFMMLLAELPNNEVIDLGPLVVRPPAAAAKTAVASTAVKL